MDCPHIPELGYGEFSKRLHEKVAGQRIPIGGSLEVTHRCNMTCLHCYLAHHSSSTLRQAELTCEELCSLFDQMTAEGCLWLLLTGGEIFIRPDILDIYMGAKRRGLLVTLFTNGTLITPRIADFLAEWRPFAIEITLYGSTQETYERITGIPGSHARCMRSIDLLMERNVPLRLKTVLLTLNKHELWDIKTYAESLGVQFRFDPMINAGLEGDQSPIAYRLSPQEIVQFERQDRKRWTDWRDFWEHFSQVRPDSRYLYTCGAGNRTFHIDPYGKLSICIMSRAEKYDLRQGDFSKGWHDFLRSVRYQNSKSNMCEQCTVRALCHQCPGWTHLEQREQHKPVTFLCQVAHLRATALESDL